MGRYTRPVVAGLAMLVLSGVLSAFGEGTNVTQASGLLGLAGTTALFIGMLSAFRAVEELEDAHMDD